MSTEWSQYSPWYGRTLIGISAWIAVILFLAFLFNMDILDSAGMTVLLGIIFLIATTLTHWKVDHIHHNDSQPTKHDHSNPHKQSFFGYWHFDGNFHALHESH